MADRRKVVGVAVPLLIVVVVAAVGVWWLRDGSDPAPVEPVDVSASGPRFADLSDLVAGSDLVVVGTVVAVDHGRTITDPSDPDAGLRTQLAQVAVSEVLVGEQGGTVIVEQEATLLDGQPVTVNGVSPLVAGDEGLMLLIRGTSDEFPYTAFVNEQGWVPIEDGIIAPIDPEDPVWRELNGSSSAVAIDAVRSATD